MVEGRDVKKERELLVDFLAESVRVYPELKTGLDKLIDITSDGLGKQLIALENKAKVFSFTISQRGLKYIVTRGSSLRNTAGYNTLSYHLLKRDLATNNEDMPMIEVELILRTLENAILLRPH